MKGMYRDDPERLVPIRWYFVPSTNPPLDINTPFRSRVLDDGLPYPSIGEVQGDRVYDRGNPPAAWSGEHYCGTPEQWLHGALSSDPVDPACCGPDLAELVHCRGGQISGGTCSAADEIGGLALAGVAGEGLGGIALAGATTDHGGIALAGATTDHGGIALAGVAGEGLGGIALAGVAGEGLGGIALAGATTEGIGGLALAGSGVIGPPIVTGCIRCPAGLYSAMRVTVTGASGLFAIFNGSWVVPHLGGTSCAYNLFLSGSSGAKIQASFFLFIGFLVCRITLDPALPDGLATYQTPTLDNCTSWIPSTVTAFASWPGSPPTIHVSFP